MSKNTKTNVLNEWPGAFGIYKPSRDAVKINLGSILMCWVLLLAANFVIGIILGTFFSKTISDTLSQLASYLTSSYFTVAIVYLYLSGARGKKIELNKVLNIVPPLFWKMFLLNLLVLVSVIAGLIFLIVPGIIIALRLSLAQYYLVDKKLDVMDAYKASWDATNGHMGKLLGIAGVVVLMLLPIITIVGIIASVYLLFMYSASSAFIYLYLSRKHANS